MLGISSYLFRGNETNQSESSESPAVSPADQLNFSVPIQVATTVENNSPEVQDKIESTVLTVADEDDSTAYSENNNLDNTRHSVFDQAAWVTAKKGRLANVIDTLVPEDVAKRFKGADKARFATGRYPTWCHIMKEFMLGNCNEPMTIQKPDKEEVWAAVMEYNFKYLISKYESDDEIKLLDVSCKQLICELFISIDTEEDAVSSTVFPLFKYLRNSSELKMHRRDRSSELSGLSEQHVFYQYYLFAFYEDFSAD